MAWMSSGAHDLGAQEILGSLEPGDLIEELKSVVQEGWECDRGAHLLTAWRRTYFADREHFVGNHEFEYAVNGRGIPDDDLDDLHSNRHEVLLRRGLAFLCAALERSQHDLPSATILGQVSVTPTDHDPSFSTGHVTFYTANEDLSPALISDTSAALVMILTASDCGGRLHGQP